MFKDEIFIVGFDYDDFYLIDITYFMYLFCDFLGHLLGNKIVGI